MRENRVGRKGEVSEQNRYQEWERERKIERMGLGEREEERWRGVERDSGIAGFMITT